MKLVMLGTGTLHPQADRASAGLAVVEGDACLLVDVGRNVLSRMVECGLDPLDLRLVLLSHLHPDHSCELVSLLFALNYALSPARTEALRLATPRGGRALVDALIQAWPWLRPKAYTLEIEEIEDGDQLEGQNLRIEAVAVEHGGVAALGYRLQPVGGGPVLAYTGDSAPCEGLLRLAAGVDLLVAECSYPDPPDPALEEAAKAHLNPRALGALATRAGCRRLLITHRYPGTGVATVEAQIRPHYSGPLLIAHDRMQLEL